MKKMILVIQMILICCLQAGASEIGPYSKNTAVQDGRRIAETAEDFNTPQKDIVIYARMILKSKDVITDTRKVILKSKTDTGQSRTLFRFTDSVKRGLTFLTIERNKDENEQYLFAPAIGRSRQIATQDRQNPFEDTDLTNEDLGGLKLDDYNYKRGRDKTVSGHDCFKVTARAKDKSARFPIRKSWIDKDTFVPILIKVYNRDNKLEKMMAAGDVKTIKGIHIPFKTVAKNLLQDHTTILEVVRVQVDTGIDSGAFDKDRMGETWNERF